MKQQKSKHLIRTLSVIIIMSLVLTTQAFPPQRPAYAAAALTVTPITWNVIGLDSNNVNVGPNHFPIGARVCNTGDAAATNVNAVFVWDTTPSPNYINIRPGTSSSLSASSIPATDPDTCYDFYFEVEVTRDANAYNTTRSYQIAVTADGGATTGSTPTPRELYVEHLISQSRNSVSDIQLSTTGVAGSYASVAPGGTMTLMVGNTYWIKLVGFTATNGYEQIESFINFPNTIFQVLAADTTYTVESSANMSPPYNRLYGDACTWENNPNSPNYRSCLSTGKAGGDITVTYQVKIISVPANPLTNPEALTSLIYDFSGSSYHYNADFGVSTRFVYVLDTLPISKAFVPDTTTPGGTSTLVIRIPNPSTGTISGVNFTDPLPTSPGAMKVATLPNASTTGCGSPTFAPGANDTTLSFSNGTIAAGTSCVIKVNVTAQIEGTYTNTTNHLFINGTTPSTGTDTGNSASAIMTVATNSVAQTCGIMMAQWTVPATATDPPDTGGSATTPGNAVTKAGNVSTASASAAVYAKTSIKTNTGQNDTYSWDTYGNKSAGQYVQFVVQTKNYSGVSLNFYMQSQSQSNGPTSIIVEYSTNGATFTTLATIGQPADANWHQYGPYDFTNLTSTTGNTYFRIRGTGANNDNGGAGLNFDLITFNGCTYTPPPTLSKAFSTNPIKTNTDTSLLTFTVGNNQTTPYDSQALTGVNFSDTLPTGLLIVNDATHLPATTCSGGTVTTVNNTTAISLAGASMAAGTTCTVTVYVKGTKAGVYDNVSGYVGAAQSGQNKTSSGYGTASLTVIDPPVITKNFGATTILTNGTTSLSFIITNPNVTTNLTGVAFTDSLPGGLVVATSPNQTGSCDAGTITAAAGSSIVSLSGASLAPEASCTFSVNVTGMTIGAKNNSVTVTSSNAGTGNTATATLIVRDPKPGIALLKQVSNSASGPWYNSETITAGSNAYYRFTVENIGDEAFTNFHVNDPLLGSPITCSPWKRVTDDVVLSTIALPVASVSADPAAYCVLPVIASAGDITNTATAQGYTSLWIDSNSDKANYKNYNFGHLPSAYLNMNLTQDGGAVMLNGSTYLGASVTNNASNGTNTETYTPKVTDDGVSWTGTWASGVGHASVSVTCQAAPCYLYVWFDWNGDRDFNDTYESGDHWTINTNGTSTISIDFNYNFSGNLPAGTYYSRFRLFAAQPNNPQPNGTALTSGGVNIVGEIEDPPITSSGSGTPTPVTVSYFRAQRQGSSVTFDWSTSTETGNVGFNLYVEDGDQMTRINTDLIPSLVVDSLERQDYTYTADVAGNTFYFEDVSTRGATERFGPFQLGQPIGDRMDTEKIDWQSIHQDNDGSYAGQQAALKNNMKLPAAALQPENNTPGMQLTTSLNMKVRQTGIYRVSYEMLRDAGLDLAGVPLRKVTVTNQGQMVPVYVEGTAKFGPGAFIEFYGQALDTLYSDTNIYTIQVSSTPASRMQGDSANVGKGLTPPTAYTETLVVNNQKVYANSAPGDDPWYDTAMFVYTTAKSWEFPFQVNGLADPAASTNLELVIWGMTSVPQNPDHHLQVRVNGISVADATFDGLIGQTLKIGLPVGVLQEGVNTLQITLPGNTGAPYDIVYLDKFNVSYSRLFQARDGRLTFTAAGKVFQVTNLPGQDVVVYRMDQSGPYRLNGVKVQAAGSTYTATFAGSNKTDTYMVTAVSALYTPVFEAIRTTADLSQPAEYLIISHPNFISGLQPLVAARQAQGLTVSVVDVTDLYSQYTYGIFDPQAIQKYIAYAAQNLGTQYVLLVGGDTYDYRNYLRRNTVSFIPSLYTNTSPDARFVPADPLYADLNGDKVPDVAIGRFPVRTNAELAFMVNKTLDYEGKNYPRTTVFASDKYDGIVSFKNISNSLAASIPVGWSVDNIHLDDLSVAAARTRLLAAMNRGTALVTFTGHSGPTSWSSLNMFNINNAAALTNAGRPFVVVQWGCWNTYYVDPVNQFLVQKFLFSGDRGAAAVLGASTLTDSESEKLLGELLTPRLVTPGMTLGQALQSAKSELAQAHPDLLDVLLGWSLMGDPALVIQP